MNLLVSLVLGAGGVWALTKVLESKADNSKKMPKGRTCRIPTEQAIFQANQAFLSKDIMFIQAVMNIFENYGCHAEALAMRDYLIQSGYNPDATILPVNTPTSGGKVLLQPGETWRAAAILGGIGCAVSLQTIADKVSAKGFSKVSVSSKNPGWGSAWDADPGFLECTRYIQGTVVGSARSEEKPKQVYRLERVSQNT